MDAQSNFDNVATSLRAKYYIELNVTPDYYDTFSAYQRTKITNRFKRTIVIAILAVFFIVLIFPTAFSQQPETAQPQFRNGCITLIFFIMCYTISQTILLIWKLVRSSNPHYCKKMLHRAPYYLGENETSIFYVDITAPLPSGLRPRLQIPGQTISHSIPVEIVENSPFYSQCRLKVRQLKRTFFYRKLATLYILAANEIMSNQFELDNIDFFTSTEPFRFYKERG